MAAPAAEAAPPEGKHAPLQGEAAGLDGDLGPRVADDDGAEEVVGAGDVKEETAPVAGGGAGRVPVPVGVPAGAVVLQGGEGDGGGALGVGPDGALDDEEAGAEPGAAAALHHRPRLEREGPPRRDDNAPDTGGVQDVGGVGGPGGGRR